MKTVTLQIKDELFGRHARPDDKCQDPFPLEAAESGLSVPIFFCFRGFPLQSLPQYIH